MAAIGNQAASVSPGGVRVAECHLILGNGNVGAGEAVRRGRSRLRKQVKKRCPKN